MILSFRHKGLERFFITGVKKGIAPDHTEKLARILDRLDASISPADMNLPGYRLHELKGQDAGTWSVMVSVNWRITFQFDGQNASMVDYLDYH
jgi:proteic killer suppression protein